MERKRKRSFKILWAILALVACPIGFNALSSFMQKRYTAEMRLMIDETTQTTAQVSNPFQQIDDIQNMNRPRSAQTQLDVLTGTIVLEDAAKMASERLPDKIKSKGRENEIYENLLRRLQVDNEVGSDVLTIKVTDEDPDVAAELANDIGLAYIDYSNRSQREAGTLLSDQLKAKIDPLVAKLTRIDAAISKIKTTSNVYDVATAEANIGATNEQAIRTLAAAKAQYEGTQAQLAVSETELKSIPQYINSATHTQTNPLYVSLQQSLATEKVALAQLQAQYQDNFPAVKEEKKKIVELEKEIRQAKQTVPSGEDRGLNPVYQNQLTVVSGLRGQVQSFAGQLSAAQTEARRASGTLVQIPKAEQELQGLLRDKTVTEQTYEQLEQRQSMVQANGMARQPSSQIVSSALPPGGPSYPDHKMLTMAGLAIGVFIAVLIMMPRPEMVLDLPQTASEVQSLRGRDDVVRPQVAAPLQPQPLRVEPVQPTNGAVSKTFAQVINKASSPVTLTSEELAALDPSRPAQKRDTKSA